jgi:hypothetical protein
MNRAGSEGLASRASDSFLIPAPQIDAVSEPSLVD